MKNVLIVAPYMGPTMRQCIAAYCRLEDVCLGIVSHQPEEAIPAEFQSYFKGHYQVKNSLNADELEVAVQAFIDEWGQVDRLIGYLEHQQLQRQKYALLQYSGHETRGCDQFQGQEHHEIGLERPTSGCAAGEDPSLEAAEAFIQAVGYPIVLKPLAGVGSKNTVRVQNEDDLAAAMNLLFPSEDNPVQAENLFKERSTPSNR